jgi:adenylate cyclase
MSENRRTVLVVDDNHMNRLILTKLLEAGGYSARTATDGAEALAALEDGHIDAILLDIVMPGVDGIDVLQSVKNSIRHFRTPVIMVSAVDEADSIVRCLELGAEDYLTKPFDPVILRARLDACLARKRFHDLEGEYHRLVEEQALELERLNLALARQVRRQEPPPDPHRAHVAVVAVAVEGVAALVPGLRPAEGLGLASAFQRVVTAASTRLGAAMATVSPLAVTLVLGDPGPSGEPKPAGRGGADDPIEAGLHLARTCIDQLAPLLERWREESGGAFVAGAGVAGGDAIVGPVGAETPHYGAVGAVVDDAQRRCRTALAQGGGIVTDDLASAGL